MVVAAAVVVAMELVAVVVLVFGVGSSVGVAGVSFGVGKMQ